MTEKKKMEKNEVITGPWRATRLWNDIVTTFQHGMPLKRHRKSMKYYDNCFTASEAVDWLHKYLKKNPNFDSDVTRDQTLRLLLKLFKAGVIRSVLNTNDTFKDNNELYSFPNDIERIKTPFLGGGASRLSPLKLNKSRTSSTSCVPLQDIPNNNNNNKKTSRTRSQSYTTESNENRIEDKISINKSYLHTLPTNSLILLLDNEDTWKDVFMNQLYSSLNPEYDQIHHRFFVEQNIEINVSYITHNMTKVSSKGIVQIDGKGNDEKDLPHWVLSAMKCLVHWPKHSKQRSEGDGGGGGDEGGDDDDEENHLVDLPNYAGFENDVFNVVKEYFTSLKVPLIGDSLYDHFVSAYIRSNRTCNRIRNTSTPTERNVLPPNSCFETAFMYESPVTRIVPQKSSDTLHLSTVTTGTQTEEEEEEEEDVENNTKMNKDDVSEEKKIKKPTKFSKWRRSSRSRKSVAVMERCPKTSDPMMKRNFNSMDNLLERDVVVVVPPSTHYTTDDGDKHYVIPSKTVRKQKHKSRRSMDSLHHRSNLNSLNLEDRFAYPTGGYYNPVCLDIVVEPESTHYHTVSYRNLVVKTPISTSSSKEDSVVRCFQLLALLLRPSDRRKLQLLLKFMKHVCTNPCLKLSNSESTSSIVLSTFSETILRPRDYYYFSRNINGRRRLHSEIIRLFLDRYEEIWKPPECLRREVEERVYQSLVSKRLRAGEDPFPITFCQRVSTETYEKRKNIGSQSALLELLRYTLFDTKLSEKERKKKVKKFKESYPEIYQLQFPEKEFEPDYIRNDVDPTKMSSSSSSSSSSSKSLSSKLKNAMRI